jgi:hypothetical protein
MRVLLYLLDKGCDGAGMGCAPRNVLVAAAAARSRGGAGYEPEKNGAGLQVEMLLQVDVAFTPLVRNMFAGWLVGWLVGWLTNRSRYASVSYYQVLTQREYHRCGLSWRR